ncbi:aldo/keto reductase [Bombilactobacillus thymidiniphilus]|uniref:Aldo/keto reductase n=1 Tax=Bombilactobacillus thymidiniphilus TaxID=2923363 RepID=A0ABY4PEZ8_9LACO|nr:aldo/keto reductase [Bombilactobacillus thymidiniphilus]UQS84167.1 aldo/keto reductase [Bombilactobacillus thymidiniphilus]
MDIPKLTTNDGLILPQIGFGTYKLNGALGVNAITSALSNHYRLLDTAFNYENEGAVGQAVKRSEVERSQIIVSSKLPGRHHHYQEALNTIQESLYRAGLDYYDLYLIHWPNPKEDLYVQAWQALITAQQMGLVRSIGVSNFLPEHIDRLIDETGVTPAVNQIELHPYFSEAPLREYDQAHQIVTLAWSPLGRASSMLQDPVIQGIANDVGRSVGQVILRWETQLGVLPIPKAAHVSRQRENLNVFDFELSPAQMQTITNLDRPDGRLDNQDPAEYEEF